MCCVTNLVMSETIQIDHQGNTDDDDIGLEDVVNDANGAEASAGDFISVATVVQIILEGRPRLVTIPYRRNTAPD